MSEIPLLMEVFARQSPEHQQLAMDYLIRHRLGHEPEREAGATADLPFSQIVAEFAAREFPPLTFLVDGLVARGALHILSGRPKSGKSWFALQLAQAVDTGQPFLGRETTSGRVRCLLLEGSEASHNRRINQLGWHSQQSVLTFKLDTVDGPGGGLGTGLEQLRALAWGFDLILIDTLSAALSGQANENDNSAMGSIMRELAAIAYAAECAILLVHHTNKGFSDDIFNTSRGASAIRGGYDVGMVLERGNNEREAVLHLESRDFVTENIVIRQSVEGAGWALVGGSGEIKRIRAGRKVIAALEELGEATVEELAEHLGLSKSGVSKQLKRAEREQLVVSTIAHDGEVGAPWDVWSLPQ